MPERSANKARYFFEPAQLPEDKLQVADFTGEEQISQLYQFELTLMSDDPEIDFGSVINQPATFTMMRRDEQYPIHGLVANFEQGSHSADQYMYRATLVPRLWRLSLTHQSRIFQDMTVEDIVRQVLKEAGLTSQDFRFSLNSSYPAREYCAQYQETDLNFVSRLLEHEGIQFFFVQGEGAEEIVFSDHGNENPPIEGDSAISYHKGAGMVPDERETVREFIYRERAVTGKVKVKDYNYETPSASLEAESQINSDMPGMRYEYGPHFRTQSEGKRLAKVRNEEIECQRKVVDGDSRCLRFRAGHQFDLERHYRGDLNAKYLITRVRHVGSQRVGMGLDPRYEDEVDYRNEFKCIPATVQYRPSRTTPVPRVPGVMTAEVDGSGDYAYLDDQGRYRAKMHFDQRGKSPGTASHPIRMKQPYTGKGEAGFHEPSHPGTEMVWACENGDPDRPMALGTAPNPTNPAPVKSENNSQHVVRTTSENEFVIEDQEDQERIELYTPFAESIFQMGYPGRLLEGIGMSTEKTSEMHAKEGVIIKSGGDFKPDANTFEEGVKTKRLLLKTIASGVGETLSLKSLKGVHDGFTSAVEEWKKGLGKPAVYMSAQEGIGLNTPEVFTMYAKKGAGIFTDEKIELVADEGGLQFATDKGGAAVFVRKGGIALRTFKGNVLGRSEKGGVKLVAGNVSNPESVSSGNVKAEAKKKIECVAQDDNVELTAESKDVKVTAKSGDVKIEAAKGSDTLKAQKEITIDAGSKITLKCGQSSITLKKSGKIEIKGMNIDIKGTQNVKIKGLNISSKADVKNDVKGTMVNSKANGINTVKGSMTKIG